MASLPSSPLRLTTFKLGTSSPTEPFRQTVSDGAVEEYPGAYGGSAQFTVGQYMILRNEASVRFSVLSLTSLLVTCAARPFHPNP